MRTSVLVLGAGFGGLELSSRLSQVLENPNTKASARSIRVTSTSSPEPTLQTAAEKAAFGAERHARWFGLDRR